MGQKFKWEQSIWQGRIWLSFQALGAVAAALELYRTKCPEDCQTASGQCWIRFSFLGGMWGRALGILLGYCREESDLTWPRNLCGASQKLWWWQNRLSWGWMENKQTGYRQPVGKERIRAGIKDFSMTAILFSEMCPRAAATNPPTWWGLRFWAFGDCSHDVYPC